VFVVRVLNAASPICGVLRSFSTFGATLNAKQRKPMQKKRIQAAAFYPRERSLCETVKNCAKKLSFN
jgi:hypothetical protein